MPYKDIHRHDNINFVTNTPSSIHCWNKSAATCPARTAALTTLGIPPSLDQIYCYLSGQYQQFLLHLDHIFLVYHKVVPVIVLHLPIVLLKLYQKFIGAYL